MLNRSVAVATLASFLALGTQSAFAESATDNAATASPATAAAMPAASHSGTQAAVSAPSTAVRVRHAARIPGTFALAGTDAPRNGETPNQAANDGLLLPPLSGDGGG
jgi:type IV secretory pathway VirB6-like protein